MHQRRVTKDGEGGGRGYRRVGAAVETAVGDGAEA